MDSTTRKVGKKTPKKTSEDIFIQTVHVLISFFNGYNSIIVPLNQNFYAYSSSPTSGFMGFNFFLMYKSLINDYYCFFLSEFYTITM